MEKHKYKFRVWHKEKEYMYDNVAIGLKGKVLYARGNPKKRGPDWYVSEEFSEDIIVMQFIGVKDDKKKEIYEGDILKIGAQEKLAKVFYNEENARYELEFFDEDKKIGFDDKRSLRGVRLAGNIFENPELLEENQEEEEAD